MGCRRALAGWIAMSAALCQACGASVVERAPSGRAEAAPPSIEEVAASGPVETEGGSTSVEDLGATRAAPRMDVAELAPEPGALRPRQPPALFAARAVPREHVLRNAIIDAFRDRVLDWLRCYEPNLCQGQAAPPRVTVELLLRDGRLHDVRAVEVREFWSSSTEVPGDLEGELALCLVRFAESVTVPSHDPADGALGMQFVFWPDVEGCRSGH